MSGAKSRSPETLGAMAHRHYTGAATGDGATVEFALPKTLDRVEDLHVFVAGLRKRVSDVNGAHDYAVRGLTPGYSGDKNYVKFTSAPGNGTDILFDVIGG